MSAIEEIAAEYGLDPAPLLAIVATESERHPTGYWDGGHPVILYECHVFHRLTNGRWSATRPEISNQTPYYRRGGYGTYMDQVRRLGMASYLDRDAAWMSASWGAMQVLGENHKDCGFHDICDFVAAMHKGTEEQVAAGVRFLVADSEKLAAIKSGNWELLARRYNGPDFEKTGWLERFTKRLTKLLGDQQIATDQAQPLGRD